jgi:hypothetical protein
VLRISTAPSSLAKVLFLLTLLALLTGCQGLAGQGGADQGAKGTLSVSPASLSFGNVVAGSSASLKASLKAAGAPVTVSSVTSTSAEFSVSGISFPAALAAGQSLSFTVSFAPQSSGAASATVSFVSNAADSPALQSLAGTGTPAPPHSVDLSWNTSQSAGVVGYNVYRGTDPPYSRINISLEASTTYTHSTVSAGTTYYYVVTAVDDQGLESSYSINATAVVPP